VLAEEQTAGVGRHGHVWHSEAGCGIYVSLVLRPALPQDSVPVLTMALGLATAEAIARSTDIECDLRWPNDVMIDERKVAGILVQAHEPAVVAGIGINVNHTAFPDDLAGEATSLRLHGGRVYSREDLLICLLPAVTSFTKMLEDGGKEPILAMFARRSSYVRGKRVTVRWGDEFLEGATAGLDPSGFLIVRQDDGTERLILAGGVRAVSSGRG
jgi:BirA family biotin operon repressor/biotin-[acetyl-CoA-carboxylase] ligase